MATSSGSLQNTVLAPFLFMLYTNNFRGTNMNEPICFFSSCNCYFYHMCYFIMLWCHKLYFSKEIIKYSELKAMVRPTLEYAYTVWDPYKEGQIRKIENVQWRSARFVLNQYKQTTSITNLLSHLGWTSLQRRWKVARLTMLYKILNNMAEVDFGRLNKTQEPKVRTPAKRDRRAHSHQLARIQCLRNYRRHSFLPRTILDWNDSLPEAVAGAASLDVFTSGVRGLHL